MLSDIDITNVLYGEPMLSDIIDFKKNVFTIYGEQMSDTDIKIKNKNKQKIQLQVNIFVQVS